MKVVYIIWEEYHEDDYKPSADEVSVYGVYTSSESAYKEALELQLHEIREYCLEHEKHVSKFHNELKRLNKLLQKTAHKAKKNPDRYKPWEKTFNNFDPDEWYGEAEFSSKSTGTRYFVKECNVCDDEVDSTPKTLLEILDFSDVEESDGEGNECDCAYGCICGVYSCCICEDECLCNLEDDDSS